MKILVKFPTRTRPMKFAKALRTMCSLLKSNDIFFVFTIDADDPRRGGNFSVADSLITDSPFSGVVFIDGLSKNKIHAVNRDMGSPQIPTWDILVVMSDDMECVCLGWDEVIRRDMAEHFPDLDGVLHYNDGNQKANVMTMSIMGRKYYDRFGYIYHPDYQSLWCDVEATEVARMLGKYRYMGDDTVLFRHLHPAWGLAPWDEQYQKTEAPQYWQQDEATYQRRKAMNFEIPVTV